MDIRFAETISTNKSGWKRRRAIGELKRERKHERSVISVAKSLAICGRRLTSVELNSVDYLGRIGGAIRRLEVEPWSAVNRTRCQASHDRLQHEKQPHPVGLGRSRSRFYSFSSRPWKYYQKDSGRSGIHANHRDYDSNWKERTAWNAPTVHRKLYSNDALSNRRFPVLAKINLRTWRLCKLYGFLLANIPDKNRI